MFYIGKYPTQHEIKDLWRYADGHLYWIKPPITKPYLINRKAGCFDNLNSHKPPRIQTGGRLYYLNRLIWIYFNEFLLDNEVIYCADENPHNCRIENLIKISEKDFHLNLINLNSKKGE